MTTVEEFVVEGGFAEDGLLTFDRSPKLELIAAEAADATVGGDELFAKSKQRIFSSFNTNF